MSHRVIRHTVSRLVIALVPWALAACAAGPSAEPPPDEPEGWIYFSPSLESDATPLRVDVRTGAIEQITFPSPFAADPRYSFHEGLVSPVDGSLTGDARFVGGSGFPETFVRDGRSGAVTVYRDPGGGPTALALDDGHAWAPDGRAIVFDRHQGQGCCREFMLLDPATGAQDTLEAFAGQVPNGYGWFGSDTLLWWRAGGPSHYRSYALATGDTATWDLVPFVDYKMPTVSPDRRWITHWTTTDSLVQGEGTVEFIHDWLLDRERGLDTLLISTRNYDPSTLFSEVFDPESRYLAYCTGFRVVRILRLATGTVVKELPVPFCWSLNWSWGPEGRPPDLGG